MKILIIGDVHAWWEYLNIFINKRKPDILISTGDFGYYPLLKQYDIGRLKNKDTKIFFCDGNHEDHWSLGKLDNNEIHPNVFYMKRGSTMEILGKTFMFFGGAHSIDRYMRKMGVDWFPEEVISNGEIEELDTKLKIDVMISHTCPTEFEIKNDYGYDFSRKALSYLLQQYKPKQWFFSHWHMYKKGFDEGCQWKCLNMTGETMWWIEWKA